MAAVEIVLSGVMFDKLARTTQQVVIYGDASLQGLSPGGGPIVPPPGGGGSPPHPDHTLPGDLPHVEHPIVLPPEGTEPPIDPKPPGAEEWVWIWTIRGWALLPPGGGGRPSPLPPR